MPPKDKPAKKSHKDRIADLKAKLPKDRDTRTETLRKGSHCNGKVRLI